MSQFILSLFFGIKSNVEQFFETPCTHGLSFPSLNVIWLLTGKRFGQSCLCMLALKRHNENNAGPEVSRFQSSERKTK